jgi:hypothetical protein
MNIVQVKPQTDNKCDTAVDSYEGGKSSCREVVSIMVCEHLFGPFALAGT